MERGIELYLVFSASRGNRGLSLLPFPPLNKALSLSRSYGGKIVQPRRGDWKVIPVPDWARDEDLVCT